MQITKEPIMLPRRLLGSTVRNVLTVARQSFFSWKNEIGPFPHHTVYAPHTAGYLEDQINICERMNVPAKIVQIPAGTKLWSFTVSGDILLGSKAVYPKESLKKLIENEFNKITYWPGNHLQEEEIREEISCILSEDPTNGRIKYYIEPAKLKLLSGTRVSVKKCIENKEIDVDSRLQLGKTL